METIDQIIGALARGTSARHITRGWPLAEDVLPVIAIRLSRESCTARYDDAAYLMETEYDLRVFARDAAQADTIAREACQCMAQMGFERTFAAEEPSAAVHQHMSRYQKTSERMNEA